MEQKTKQKMSTKKKASAVVAGVLAVTLALGGAYAWTDYSQNARNTFKGAVAADVLLHDDFDGENKDVYVENTGESEVFVRVKFAEYLQIGNKSLLTAYSEDGVATDKKANPDDVTTWPVHQFEDAEAEDNTCNLSTHSYFEWNMTGNHKQYLAGVTESNSEGYGGLSKEAFEALTVGADVTLGDITTQKMNTLAASPVMMLSEWVALETKPAVPCWLLDTDGWAYWSKALAPNTATNLLLDSVEATDSAPYDNWVYHIDVQLQAASITELDGWYVDGEAEVADPDNSVATATENGRAFVEYYASDYINIADGTTKGADGETYRSVANNVYVNVSDTSETPTYILAGQDGKLGTEDDNKLAGRIDDDNKGIGVTNIDIKAMTYQIDGAGEDYVVTAGVDKKLGTYDDVITSKTGALGTYEIDGVTPEKENVGWIYLGGPITNMLVATEYVLDNVQFSSDSTAYAYEGSDLQKKIVEIGGAMGITATVNKVELDMSGTQHTGNQIKICIKGCEEGNHSGCIYDYSSYYTDTDPQANITDTYYFALSLKEVFDAYGDSNNADIRQLRIVQGAPAYVRPAGTTERGNSNNSTTWKDGNGNFITTSNYWLRSPGYWNGRGTSISDNCYSFANSLVTNITIGARPACYLNLSATTTAQ